MGCFLVLLVVSGSHTNRLAYLSAERATDWPATVARDQSYAAYMPGSFHSELNSLQKEPIEWTNAARVPTEPAAFPRLTTNTLIR
jgi:hypothetical protein